MTTPRGNKGLLVLSLPPNAIYMRHQQHMTIMQKCLQPRAGEGRRAREHGYLLVTSKGTTSKTTSFDIVHHSLSECCFLKVAFSTIEQCFSPSANNHEKSRRLFSNDMARFSQRPVGMLARATIYSHWTIRTKKKYALAYRAIGLFPSMDIHFYLICRSPQLSLRCYCL